MTPSYLGPSTSPFVKLQINLKWWGDPPGPRFVGVRQNRNKFDVIVGGPVGPPITGLGWAQGPPPTYDYGTAYLPIGTRQGDLRPPPSTLFS